jgi:hypothetical protein
MKSSKKTKTPAAQKSNVRKTSVAVVKTSALKKKKDVKLSVSKTPCSQTRTKNTPKSCKSSTAKTVKSVKPARNSGKTGKSIAKRNKERRHQHELSAREYDAFVIQEATREHVLPEELVTVDRRKDKSSLFAEPITEQEPQFRVKQDRRQKIQRRRQIDPTTCERDYSQEEIEFMNALDEYKRNSGRMFPTCSEILEVFRNLGYTKQSYEESVEIRENPESGDILITTTESGTMYRAGHVTIDP